ncbi:MAG: hypothetical protein BZ138_04715 [Methanosphaera sp. rholeuAM270]|nr:MAG: hypothetical protein BZ138_04715 [Methanosphaera sp. rholeuAM270]
MKNRILVIGPITKDHIITPDNEYYQLGGAAYYQTMTLKQLKKDSISIISIGKNDTDLLNNTLKKQIMILQEKTHQYTNIYDKDLKRKQKAELETNEIKIEETTIDLSEIKYALISPLSPYDISAHTIEYLKNNNIITILTAQGYLRKTDKDNNIVEREWTDKEKYLKYTDILCLDEKEALKTFNTKKILEEEMKKNLKRYTLKQIIITRAENGSIIFTKEKTYKIPAIKTSKIIDATGLGDTYIAAYIAKLEETENIRESGLFASITAKEKLKRKGPLKTGKKILEEELNKYR